MADRVFVALWPDVAVRHALSRDLDQLRRDLDAQRADLDPRQHASPVRRDLDPLRDDPGDVRWQPAHRWHVTIAFLGQRDVARAATRIDRLLARHPLPTAEPVRLVGSGTFGTAIWAGVEHGPWLDHVAEVLRPLHLDNHRFHAHLTVGRTRGPQAARRARLVAARLAPVAGPWWTPEDVTLVRSQEGPKPEYAIVQRWPLPGASAPPAGTGPS